VAKASAELANIIAEWLRRLVADPDGPALIVAKTIHKARREFVVRIPLVVARRARAPQKKTPLERAGFRQLFQKPPMQEFFSHEQA
jgi:hypothetical protein